MASIEDFEKRYVNTVVSTKVTKSLLQKTTLNLYEKL